MHAVTARLNVAATRWYIRKSQLVYGAFQWDLVCGKEALVEMSQTIMVIGVMIGAMVFTAASDAIGRKPVFLFR